MHRIAMIPIKDLGPAHAAAPVVVHTDVRTPKIWTFASVLNTNCVTLSWPCQSFANSGGGSGWHDTITSIFNGALKYCQLAKVPILLLENAPPVWEKTDFCRKLQSNLDDHGYVLGNSWCVNMKHVSPIDRRRFLGARGPFSMLQKSCVQWDGVVTSGSTRGQSWHADP